MLEIGALFLSLAGATAGKLLKKAAERHVEKAFQGSIEGLAGLGKKKPMVEVMELAWKLTLDIVIEQVRMLGWYREDAPELKKVAKALLRMLKNDHVGVELLKAVLDPDDEDAVDADVLAASWNILNGPELPEGFTWETVIRIYRTRLKIVLPKTEGLREQLDSENLAAIRKLLEGVAPKGNEAKYARTVRARYRVLDLSALRPGGAPGQRPLFEVQKVFVPQQIRLDPPREELPRDVLLKLAEEEVELPGEEDEEFSRRLERAREAFSQRPPKPVLQTLAEPANKHVVLIGDPGSGKSTLTRYLLLSTLGKPDHGDEEWIKAYRGHLPLLLELREFQLAYAEKRCKGFLDYWQHLGETEGYHLERVWLNDRLSTGPTLVLFDGLDEIFSLQRRKTVMRAIASFARDYPSARIVVTSRPIGYAEEVFRTAGFRHYGIEELDEERIQQFVQGWFQLLFPNDAKGRALRAQRIQDALERPSVRLLAGNPMLLTIMAVIAEKEALPDQRSKFFQSAAETLAHHWEVGKELEDAVLPEGFGLPEKKELLSKIAFRLQSGKGGLKGNAISEKALVKEVSTYLAERYGLPRGTSDGLARNVIAKLHDRDYILCLWGSGVYGFLHRTFLEYFCALWWVERLQNDPAFSIEDLWTEVFAKHWPEAEWNEVLRLICGMVGEKNSRVLLRGLLEEGKPGWLQRVDREAPGHLILALQCLSELRNPREVENEYVEALEFLWRAMTAVSGNRIAHQIFAEQLREHVLPTVRRGGLPQAAAQRCKQLLQREFQRLRPFLMPFVGAKILIGWIGGEPADFTFLETEARRNQHEFVRSRALEALAKSWRDDDSRELITHAAKSDQHEFVRSTALEALAKTWPDGDTRKLIEHTANNNEANLSLQETALQALARTWADDDTRRLMTHSVQHEREAVRGIALQALAKTWPDDNTRKIISNSANNDDNNGVRITALKALAQSWPDDDTRNIITTSANNDDNEIVRSTALRFLAQSWPDDNTRKIITNSAINDDHQYVRGAALQALVTGKVDRPALVLLSEDLDGFGPFLDPREAIPQSHLKKGAKKLGLSLTKIREILAGCEKVLGWNPLLGTRGTAEAPEESP